MVFVPIIALAQYTVPEKPSVANSVYDYAQLLSANQKKELETKLIQYADSTSNQIVVAIIPNLKNEAIASLATNWAQKWGIGDAEKDNGVFILLSTEDRKIHIVPGYGLESKLTAGLLGTITRKEMIPYFKEGDFYGGLDNGTSVIIKAIKGTYKADKKAKKSSGFPIAVIIVIIILVLAKRGGRGGNNRGGGLDLGDVILLSSLGRGGFGGKSGGSFGGGGFSGGFGGGGFSGGGAGGSW